jgi:hypothetical protein
MLGSSGSLVSSPSVPDWVMVMRIEFVPQVISIKAVRDSSAVLGSVSTRMS